MEIGVDTLGYDLAFNLEVQELGETKWLHYCSNRGKQAGIYSINMSNENEKIHNTKVSNNLLRYLKNFVTLFPFSFTDSMRS